MLLLLTLRGLLPRRLLLLLLFLLVLLFPVLPLLPTPNPTPAHTTTMSRRRQGGRGQRLRLRLGLRLLQSKLLRPTVCALHAILQAANQRPALSSDPLIQGFKDNTEGGWDCDKAKANASQGRAWESPGCQNAVQLQRLS